MTFCNIKEKKYIECKVITTMLKFDPFIKQFKKVVTPACLWIHKTNVSYLYVMLAKLFSVIVEIWKLKYFCLYSLFNKRFWDDINIPQLKKLLSFPFDLSYYYFIFTYIFKYLKLGSAIFSCTRDVIVINFLNPIFYYVVQDSGNRV